MPAFARSRLPLVLLVVSSIAVPAAPAGATCPIGGYPPPPPPSWWKPEGTVTATGRVPTDPEPAAPPADPYGGPSGTIAPRVGGTTPTRPDVSPGAPSPGGHAPARAGRGTTPGGRRRAATSADFDWQTWWWYNQFRFLEFEREEKIATDSTDFFLGAGDRSNERKAATARTPVLLRDRILPAVIEELDSSDSRVRAAAVMAIGRIGEGTPVDRIAKLVADPDRQVRLAATVVLGETESRAHIPLLLRLASDATLDTTQRGHAAIALGLIGDEGCVPTLKKISLDPGEVYDVRMCALSALGLIPCEETRKTMRALATDKKAEANFRALAAGTLGRICGDADTADLLVTLSTDRAPQVRESAIIALGSQDGSARIGDALARALEDDTDLAARAFACIALGEQKSPRAKKLLLETFGESPHVSLRSFAAIGLGLLGDASVRPALREGLAKDSYPASLRGAAAVALGLLRDRESVSLLVRLASDAKSDPAVRGNAALALGLVGDRNALPVVGEVFLTPQPPSVIGAIAHAVGLLGGPATSEMLVAAMARSDNDAQRSHILHAMGHVRDAGFIDPFLKRLADETATDMARADTVMALGHLGDRYAKPWLSALTDHRNFMLFAPTLDAVAMLR